MPVHRGGVPKIPRLGPLADGDRDQDGHRRRREEARAEGAAIIEEMRAKAQEEATRITTAARASIEAERQQAMNALMQEVGAIATTLASKIVGESLEDQARQSRVVDRFLEDLERSK